MLPPPPAITCRRCAAAASAAEPGDDEWGAAEAHVLVEWSGKPDPLAASRGASTFRLLWDPRALHLRVDAAFAVLHVDGARPTDEKSHGLWDHDVAELFLSRGPEPLPYAEVEGSPLGQWLDYLIAEPRTAIDHHWSSGARVRGAVGAGRFTVAIDLPWASLGASAAVGAAFRFNVYLAQGPPGQRRHLAFSPTGTAVPDFHVPARFAYLRLG